MMKRNHIETAIFALTYDLHEVAVYGITEANMVRLRALKRDLDAALQEAEALRPRLLLDSNPGRCRGPVANRVEPTGLGIDTSAVCQNDPP